MMPGKNGAMYHAKNKRPKDGGLTLDEWRKVVIGEAAEAAMQANPDWPRSWDGPCAVGILFRYYSPTRDEREYKISTPDLDKLERAVLDSLTFAQVIKDDKQVCDTLPRDKRWTRNPEKQGALITVATLEPRG
jgi:Holliday junction resolvase RusA-like endonuclease